MDSLLAWAHKNVSVVHYGQMLLLAALLFILHWAMTRHPSRWYAWGFAAIAILSLLSVAVAHSAAWVRVATVFVP